MPLTRGEPAANNGNSVALSGGTIPASGSCTVTVNVTAAAAGSSRHASSSAPRTGSRGLVSSQRATA